MPSSNKPFRFFVSKIFHRMNLSSRKSVKPNRKELHSLMIKTKESALNRQSQLNASSVRMQEIADSTDVLLPFIGCMPDNDIEKISELYGKAYRDLELMESPGRKISALSDTAGGTVFMGNVIASGVINNPGIDFQRFAVDHTALENFNTSMSRPEYKESVIKLLHDFHLDLAHPGKKSTLELFEIAHNAFENPVSINTPAITSLIPLREAIESAIDELIRVRPTQQPTGSSQDKRIKGIFEQLRKDTVDDIIVQKVVDQWNDISNHDLSASKRYEITREEWKQKLSRATLFLYSFLSYLDVSKLRK